MDEVVERHAQVLRSRMVAALVNEGVLRNPRWCAAFEQVPRHMFLRRFFHPHAHGGWEAMEAMDPGWLRMVYSDRVWVTQLDGDDWKWDEARQGRPTNGTPTSSSSMPTIMAIMLEALDVHTGQTVLEVGTGTGYNAALLCHYLGASNVTTIDVDQALLLRAQEQLTECGYRPAAALADGERGYPPAAPYHRLLATCSVSSIPLSWLEQTVPGGFVVTTLNRPIGAGLVRITAGHGACGQGRVLPADGRFMPLRAHRWPDIADLLSRAAQQDGETRYTPIGIEAVISPSSPFEFFVGLELPGVQPTPSVRADGQHQAWLLHPDGSWVRHFAERGRYAVEQGGPRRLWNTVETAYERWQRLGKPRRGNFGITVTPRGQALWLDTTKGRFRWPLAGADRVV